MTEIFFAIKAILDDSILRQMIGQREWEIQQIEDAQKAAEEKNREIMNNLWQGIRSSYMMMYGLARAFDVGMSQAFFAAHSTIVATIGTYKAIAAAVAASSPAGWIQAGIMYASLITAIFGLVGVMAGEKQFGRQMRGLTTALHGAGGMVHSFLK